MSFLFFFFFLFGPNTLSLSDPISDALSDPIYDPISWQSGTRKWVRRHPWGVPGGGLGLKNQSIGPQEPPENPQKSITKSSYFWGVISGAFLGVSWGLIEPAEPRGRPFGVQFACICAQKPRTEANPVLENWVRSRP